MVKRKPRNPLAAKGWRTKAQLYGVLSTSEVCNGWHVHYKTVIAAIHAGNITARKAGKQWMISYRSCVAWWGKPIEARVYQDVE